MEGKSLRSFSDDARIPERRQSDRIKSKLSSSSGAILLTNYIHPPTSTMVQSALRSLNREKGLSYQAIIKYISNTYDTNIDKMRSCVKKYLKFAVASGLLNQLTGTGACGSFKLAIEAKKPNISSKAKNNVETTVNSTKKGLLGLDTPTKKSKKSESHDRSDTENSDELLTPPRNHRASRSNLSNELPTPLHSFLSSKKDHKVIQKFQKSPEKIIQKKKLSSEQSIASIAASQPFRCKRLTLSRKFSTDSSDNVEPSISSDAVSKSPYKTRNSSKSSLSDSIVTCNSLQSTKFTVKNSKTTKRSKRK